MKNVNLANIKSADQKTLLNIQRMFRRWYGSLSVRELSTNPELTKRIAALESQLSSALSAATLHSK